MTSRPDTILTRRVYLLALPALLALAPAAGADQGSWKTVCELPDMEVAHVRDGIKASSSSSLARAGQAWLRQGDKYAILTMPGCNAREVKMPDIATPIAVHFVSAGGYLLKSWDRKTGLTSWWVGNGALRPMPRPPSSQANVAPLLSEDGSWVAWQEPGPAPRHRRVVIRSLHDDREELVDLADPTLSPLLDVDMARQELTFYQYDYAHQGPPRSSLVVLGLDGARRGLPLVAEGVEPLYSTFLRVGSGWVAWDATREGAFQPYRIAWSVAAGKGSHRTTAGRSITDVAVSPAGSYIAVSETNSTRIHVFQDAVYVLRARDGKPVWSRTLPAFARSSLAFLGDDLFVYTEVAGSRSTVRVLQIP